MGPKGAFLLSQYLKSAQKVNKKHLLRVLDLSYNELGSAGVLKLLSRLKKSTELASLNFSGNDLMENQEKFINLEKFLSRNESCVHLQLNNCQLKCPAMVYMGLGLAKNVTLERLSLGENLISERESMQYLVRGLLDNVEGSKLVDIDLHNNRMTAEAIEPLAELFVSNFKIRTMNLRHNLITDEGGQLLLQSAINNEYITKFHLDMNPVRHSILADIEAHTLRNLHKVHEQEVPTMIEEIIDVKKATAQALFDCALDPMIKDKMKLMMHPARLSNLKRANSRGGSLHRRTEGPVPKQE